MTVSFFSFVIGGIWSGTQAVPLPSIYIIIIILEYVTRFDESWLPHTLARLTFPHHLISTSMNYVTIHVCIIANGSLVCLPGVCFSGLSDMLKCLGGLQMAVVITHPAGNCHTTGQKAWPPNWLLFVVSRAQMSLRWDFPAVSTSTNGKSCHLHGSPPPYVYDHLP